jgi:hypothetical protein
MPGELVDHADPHPVLGLRAAVEVLKLSYLYDNFGGETRLGRCGRPYRSAAAPSKG